MFGKGKSISLIVLNYVFPFSQILKLFVSLKSKQNINNNISTHKNFLKVFEEILFAEIIHMKKFFFFATFEILLCA